MKTTFPIVIISYNSEEFLVEKLNELKRNHKISGWFFIYHFVEVDELKNHFHVWMKPNGKVDTMELQNLFTEYNSDDPEHPFKCIVVGNSSLSYEGV